MIPSGPITEQATRLEFIRQTLLADVEAGSNALRSLASNVCPDRIVEVRVRGFSGQVYNLQTLAGWFIANGVATHNCAMVPVTRTMAELGISGVQEEPLRIERGPALFGRLSKDDQERILGPAAFNASKLGTARLQDFVGRSLGHEWGAMRYTRSLRDILGAQRARGYVQLGRMPAMAGGSQDVRSQHPADVLIRELIAIRRRATPEEIGQIVRRMAGAPFPTADGHVAQRVAKDEQWAAATTREDYGSDLRAAIEHPDARLAVYNRRGGPIALVLTNTDGVIPPDRLGQGSLPLLLVVYSADRGILLSGYQASSMTTISIPRSIRWLK